MNEKTYRVVVPVDGTLCYVVTAASEAEAAAIGRARSQGRGPHDSFMTDSVGEPIVKVVGKGGGKR